MFSIKNYKVLEHILRLIYKVEYYKIYVLCWVLKNRY